MPIANRQWISELDGADTKRYENYRSLGDLEHLIEDTAYDLVVVGGGGSGAVAAIEAADSGASVLVLEKTGAPGGSTQISGGTIRLVDDEAGTAEHLWHLAQGATPRAVVDAFVAGLAEVPEWIAQHGGELVTRGEGPGGATKRVFPISRPGSSFPNFPCSEALAPRALMTPALPGRENGAALWDFLCRNLAERSVPVVTGAKVVHLVQDSSTRAVTGVEIERPGGAVTVVVTKAVVLCTGGFAYDDELMTQYYGLPLPTVCPPGRATGDGIRLAQEVGADLWHMSAVAASVGYRPPDLDAGFQCKMPAYGFVMVDQLALRYVAETALENHSAVHVMLTQDAFSGEYLRTPSFVILDDETRRAGSLAHVPHGANRHYPWSADNSAEIDRGWIAAAASIAELAGKLGLPAADLERTVEQFNACAAKRVTDAFGREPAQMLPISTPPFYGAAVFPIIVNTQGGPRRSARGEIVRPDGSPIKGLYGAGELGSIWNRLYPGAGNICECIVSGRLAVASALAA